MRPCEVVAIDGPKKDRNSQHRCDEEHQPPLEARENTLPPINRGNRSRAYLTHRWSTFILSHFSLRRDRARRASTPVRLFINATEVPPHPSRERTHL